MSAYIIVCTTKPVGVVPRGLKFLFFFLWWFLPVFCVFLFKQRFL